MQSSTDKKASEPSDDEAEQEPREYSSPPCYLHEFEQQPATKPKPASDSEENTECK
jgi:hypothetical protein